jgi:hypothetical protein
VGEIQFLCAEGLGEFALVYSMATNTDGRQEGTANDTEIAPVDRVRQGLLHRTHKSSRWKWPRQLEQRAWGCQTARAIAECGGLLPARSLGHFNPLFL